MKIGAKSRGEGGLNLVFSGWVSCLGLNLWSVAERVVRVAENESCASGCIFRSGLGTWLVVSWVQIWVLFVCCVFGLFFGFEIFHQFIRW